MGCGAEGPACPPLQYGYGDSSSPIQPGAEPLPQAARWLHAPGTPQVMQPSRCKAALPNRAFLVGLTREASSQGLPPITRSKGPHSSIYREQTIQTIKRCHRNGSLLPNGQGTSLSQSWWGESHVPLVPRPSGSQRSRAHISLGYVPDIVHVGDVALGPHGAGSHGVLADL